MEGVSSSIIVAAAMTGLLALPMASDNVSPTGSFSAPDQSEAPVEMTTRTGPNSFVKEVSTAFEEFRMNITGNRSRSVLETPESQIETVQKPGKTVRTLETSTGVYQVINSSEKRVERVEVPEGELIRKVENGKIVEKFDGVNRSRVDSLKTRLEIRYEEEIEGLRQRYEAMNERSGPEIDIYVQPDPSVEEGEYIRLRNTGSETVDLEGWRVEDEASNSYTFESASLEPDESLKLYSSNDDSTYNWDSGYVWNMNGDTAYIYNEDDRLVAEKSY